MKTFKLGTWGFVVDVRNRELWVRTGVYGRTHVLSRTGYTVSRN